MELVTVKNSLKKHIIAADIKQRVMVKITSIPEYRTLKLNTELTLFICNIIENEVKKQDGIVKLDLVVSILSTIYGLSVDEINVIKEQIQFLYNNGKIKKATMMKKIRRSIVNLFLKNE